MVRDRLGCVRQTAAAQLVLLLISLKIVGPSSDCVYS